MTNQIILACRLRLCNICRLLVFSQTKNMELYEREKALEERERKLELREIELEKISYKLAVTCQTKVNAQEINEQLEVSYLMRRVPGTC